MNNANSVFTFLIDRETRGKLELLSKACNRSCGAVIRELISIAAKRHLEREGQRTKDGRKQITQ